MDKLLETNDDFELLTAIRETWQQDLDNLDRHIAKLQDRLANAQAERTALVARMGK
jgi:predicted  nucleic acid-binding Zn-ribbon protein